jgi:hypothetical protein
MLMLLMLILMLMLMVKDDQAKAPGQDIFCKWSRFFCLRDPTSSLRDAGAESTQPSADISSAYT